VVVTVQVVEDVSDSPRGRQRAAPSPAIARLTNEFGIEFRAVHAGTADHTLRTWYVADLPDDARGAQMLRQLRNHPLVAAAYVKAAEALP
jgi:hypothetical protein